MTDTLPALVGSDKQITWATTIRDGALAVLDQFRAAMAAHVAEHPDAAAEQAANNNALDQAIAQHPDARWWIDTRHSGPDGIAYTLRREANALLPESQ
jgi:hypothetical protein